ncbi:MAG: hypothetical protein KIS88_10265 [Anaerolineales bacterium]|nr:hypothetical protein [Anaerolineales bacterium]
MPSIQLGQLQQEAAQLSEYFNEPEVYLRQLEHLLQAYATPVHRQGRIKGMRPILFSFEVPPPVLRRLEMEMSLQAGQQPAAALAIADVLWERRSYETRLLAIRLLGNIPAAEPEVGTRLEAWASENQEELLLNELHERGTRYMAASNPEALLHLAQRLLATGEFRKQVLSLGSLQTLLATGRFANLPALFTALLPISQDPPRKLQPFLADLLVALAQQTPKETAYFLGQALSAEPSEGSRWVARQVLRHLPAEMQAGLRELAK